MYSKYGITTAKAQSQWDKEEKKALEAITNFLKIQRVKYVIYSF
jgi:uncharacterized membrane-anchored protein YitT (DUF2179 family)